MSKITLLIYCPDTSGIIAHVTSFFYKKQGNIIYIDQYVDVENTVFFMRLECEFNAETNISATKDEFKETVAEKYNMSWEMYSANTTPRMAVFVSKYDHCLYDILSRYKSNELKVIIPLIISNHKDLEQVAQNFGIPFHHIPVTAQTKEKAAEFQLELLQKEKVDFIVLARYMQIIPKSLITAFPNRIINIHHSFLPAFAGAKPYHLAYKR
ncbi:formyltetrahydrofolate deformylase, partial [Salegentibacter salinarum]